MTTTVTTAEAIRTALAATTGGVFAEKAANLLAALDYRSDHVPPTNPASVGDFIAEHPAPNPGTQSETMFADNTQSVRILFQFTDAEIASTTQRALLNAAGFSTGNARSFLFVAVELKGDNYARGQYVAFTREINKRWQIPTVVLFRTAANRVSLAFVHRRPYRRDPNRDVLGSVSLIREIDAANPHRAHLDILADLSLQERLLWMDSHGKAHNFDGLLEAWLDALDTEALNRRFYWDLFDWFQRAVNDAKLPDAVTKKVSREEHVIRLITRLLFVWFIKEKGLVADDLFIENHISQLLKDYDADAGDSYYRAVLQNLFFATLNTEISERRFSQQNNDDHRNFSVYRYFDEMADPDALLELFGLTPFINGGLFDCLDSFDATSSGDVRIDCFTDNARHRAGYSIPNRLFFDEDGLITLFDHYKFTVEENTPAEREVALDPELLGKVFENLLAAFNPETRENARKQTGSYYTPRAVVDYMVDEALVATLAQKAAAAGDADFLQARLRYLLDYDDAFSDAETLFAPAEREAIVGAIAETRVMDPAVGSGAFPMGVLHKLTLALRRLDPQNELWESLQKELAGQRAASAFDTSDQAEREAELKEISDTFERYRNTDFGRKLYIIQNGIYGVDIQPIATQIAKLRFFISLAIDQESNDDPDANYGIKPLPNLETRFVAADSLLRLDRPAQMALGETGAVQQLHGRIRANRERHFHAKTRQQKQRYRGEDKRLREESATALEEAGFAAASAKQIADWDPYDQNARADWFDGEYMFGVSEGFDVVIGNPPYVQLQKDAGLLANLYQDAGYATYIRTGDIYQLFCEQGCNLLRAGTGILSFITSNSWLRAEYGKPLRNYFARRHTPLQLLEMGKDVFENTIVDASILLLQEGRQDGEDDASTIPAVDMDRLGGEDFPPEAERWSMICPDADQPWSILSTAGQSVMAKMRVRGTPLSNWNIVIYRGVTTGLNDAFIIDGATRAALVADDPKSAEIIKPVLRGRNIQRYRVQSPDLHLVATFPALELNIDDYPGVKRHLTAFGKERLEQSGKALKGGGKTRKKTRNKWFETQDSTAYHEQFAKEKLLWIELVEDGRFAYDNSGIYGEATTFIMTGECIKFLCGVLNAQLVRWYLGQIAPTSGMGTLRWKKVYVETIPIPRGDAAQQRPLVRLVDRILEAKAANPAADTAELEAEIDRRVYGLYGLTDEEIAAVEGRG